MAVHKKPSAAVKVQKAMKVMKDQKAVKAKKKKAKTDSPNHEELTLEEKMEMFVEKACGVFVLFGDGFCFCFVLNVAG